MIRSTRLNNLNFFGCSLQLLCHKEPLYEIFMEKKRYFFVQAVHPHQSNLIFKNIITSGMYLTFQPAAMVIFIFFLTKCLYSLPPATII